MDTEIAPGTLDFQSSWTASHRPRVGRFLVFVGEEKMKCLKCHEDNQESSNFCKHCGAPLEQTCSQCGHGNEADARFCNKCGTPLNLQLCPF